jgi:hypothetical protein
MNMVTAAILVGSGATAATDLWAVARRRLLGVAPPDYGLVGRWLGHMTRGRFHHPSIAAATAIPGEKWIGWVAHYLIGIAYAALLLALWGPRWLHEPSLAPAMIVGIGTVAAPFFLMQPGMGAGIAASRTPHPRVARFHSLAMHAVFGFGLYVTGLAIRILPLS